MLGYIAGLIDGEGYIGITKAFAAGKSRNFSYSGRVMITGTDLRLFSWLIDNLGGSLHLNNRPKHQADMPWKQAYHWVCFGANAERLLNAVMPYLVIKREQAEVVLHLRKLTKRKAYTLSDEDVAEREALKQRIHLLNRRGVA